MHSENSGRQTRQALLAAFTACLLHKDNVIVMIGFLFYIIYAIEALFLCKTAPVFTAAIIVRAPKKPCRFGGVCLLSRNSVKQPVFRYIFYCSGLRMIRHTEREAVYDDL